MSVTRLEWIALLDGIVTCSSWGNSGFMQGQPWRVSADYGTVKNFATIGFNVEAI